MVNGQPLPSRSERIRHVWVLTCSFGTSWWQSRKNRLKD